ncbi:MAG: hypothetical protein QM831_30450 [Kofleriaceae bacterium]
MKNALLVVIAACGGPTPMPVAPTPVAVNPPPIDAAPPANADVVKTATIGGIPMEFRAGRMANVLQQIDCLADLVVCSSPAFASIWQLDANDKRALLDWHELRSHYSGTIEEGLLPEPEPLLPLAYHPRDIESAIRIAGFTSRDPEDYYSRLSIFMTAADVQIARGVVEHFIGRADAMWAQHRTELVTSLDGYRTLAARDDMKALAADIAHFYGIDPKESHQTFELIWRPVHKSPTSAQQLVEVSVVEATSGEPASEQWPVVNHEMFHGWFGASPIAKQVQLVNTFLGYAGADPITQPAYALLDEVLATAFGNGLVARLADKADYERRLAQPQGFYNDPHIDAIAKALLPALEKRLAAHGTVFDPDFVGDYLSAAHTAVKDWAPSTYLRDMTFVYTPMFEKAAKKVQGNASYSDGEALGGNAIATAQKHPGWGTALFVTKKELDQLAPLLTKQQLVSAKSQKAPAFVLAAHRQPVGAVFVFVAPDAEQMAALVDKFLATQAWTDLLI